MKSWNCKGADVVSSALPLATSGWHLAILYGSRYTDICSSLTTDLGQS
ncbi:unnamed protein product [Haemonchus placei]|uniref:Uncharacterized protein n=1 Tax=Haemonchus placei TaxID=6290 RepID=A0A0N4WS91_HAEPC|nr:unnamed protein product [Haemonchus placei]